MMTGSFESEDRERKRKVFISGNLALGLVVIFLGIFNFLSRAWADFILDLLLLPFTWVNIWLIRKKKHDGILYRVWIGVLGVLVLEGLIRGTGLESGILWPLAFPVAFFFFLEEKEGLLWAVSFFAMSFFLVMLGPSVGTHSYSIYFKVGFVLVYFLIALTGYRIEASRRYYFDSLKRERKNLIVEKARLEEAVGKIETLTGLLPICSHCHKIRDDKGYWQRVESYLKERSGFTFTHSICPECAARYYGLDNKDPVPEDGSDPSGGLDPSRKVPDEKTETGENRLSGSEATREE